MGLRFNCHSQQVLLHFAKNLHNRVNVGTQDANKRSLPILFLTIKEQPELSDTAYIPHAEGLC